MRKMIGSLLQTIFIYFAAHYKSRELIVYLILNFKSSLEYQLDLDFKLITYIYYNALPHLYYRYEFRYNKIIR